MNAKSTKTVAISTAPSAQQGRDLVNQMMGQAQALNAGGDFLRTGAVSKWADIKNNRLYQHVRGMLTPHGAELTGTWEDFCINVLGRSVDQVDRDITNLQSFGEQALDSMQAAGIGYRELRQFRKLPDDEKQALIELAKDGDKETILEAVQQIIAKSAKEKDAIKAELNEAQADIKDMLKGQKNRDAQIETLTNQNKALSDKQRLTQFTIETELLRREAFTLAEEATLPVQGLIRHWEELQAKPAEHPELMLQMETVWFALHSVLGQALAALNTMRDSRPEGLRDTLALEHIFTADEAADWQRDASTIKNAHDAKRAARMTAQEDALIAARPRGKGRPKGSKNDSE